MAKKPEIQRQQLDIKDELLNFDLEELLEADAQAEDEVIELVELVESEQDEDMTRELNLKSPIREKAPAKTAKAAPIEQTETSVLGNGLTKDEEETELDLSDLTLDMDMETTRPAKSVGADEITEADLENLLQEASDEELTFELSSDKEGAQEGKNEEVTDADLEALLQKATAEGTEESEEEEEILELISVTEVAEEIEVGRDKPSLPDRKLVGDTFEETQTVTEPLAEEEAPVAVRAETEERIVPEEPMREESAAQEPSVEKITGISEERLEEIITKVVQDVVERVARETMASVAERVIGQAIEALRASLETSSEES